MAMRFRNVLTFALGLAFAAGSSSCGGAAAPENVEAPAPKPRNAAEIAQAIVGAKVGALVYVDRTRNHPLGARVAALNVWRSMLEGTGIDPQRDFERAYVAAPSVRAGDKGIVVAQHSLPPERVQKALESLIAKSDPPGRWLEEVSVPAALVTVRRQTRVVAVVEPSFLVILPEAHARDAGRFVGTGGFPDPAGSEAVVATALEPSRSLKAPHAPRVPETIRSARATITLSPDGGADIAGTGQSESEAQATADAEELTEAVDRATSLKIAIIKIRLFGPVEFRPEGDQVKTDVHLTPGDIDKLFGLLSAVMPDE